MGACLSAPRPAAADAPSSSSVSSARTFGVTPAKASAATDARAEPVRSDAPGEAAESAPAGPRAGPPADARERDAGRGGFGSFLQAKVRDDPEPIARALAKEWDAPGAGEVAPASDAGAAPGPADATDDRAPPAEEPVELERDVELELSASDASDDDAPPPGGDAPDDPATRDDVSEPGTPRPASPEEDPRPREPSEEEANEEEDRDDDDDDDDDDAGSGPGSRGAASPPESKARSSNAADSDFEDDFEDTLSMIDMGPVSDSEEDSDYGSVADPAEAALAEEAIPEDARERGGARSEERTRPPSEEEAPEVEPPVDDAPPPGRGDEVASEGEVLGEEARGSADAAAAAAAAEAAAEEAAETTGASRDERPSDQPADDPASETLDERPSDQPADDPASDASSGYESTVYSDEEADDFDAELGPTVLSTVEPREQTVDANLVEVLARSKHSPPPTARTRGFVGQVTPRDGSHPSSRGATPLGSARSGGSHASDQAKADSDSSRGPFGWLPFGGGGGGARSARSAGRGGGGGSTARSGASSADWTTVVVLYVTSLNTVRKTAGQCQRVKQTLANLGVDFLERDVSMATAYKEELKRRLGLPPGDPPPGKPPVPLVVPCLFVDDELVDRGEALDDAAASGALKALLEERGRVGRKLGAGECAACGGKKLVICAKCDGTMRWVMTDHQRNVDVERRCPWCNEVGMQECGACVPKFARTTK